MKGILDIGIDPGVKTGVAVREVQLKVWLVLATMTFWGLIEVLEELPREYEIRKIVIEDPNANKPVFPKRGVSATEVRKREKIAQNVGSNKRDAQLLLEWCRNHDLPVIASRPTAKSLTNLSVETF